MYKMTLRNLDPEVRFRIEKLARLNGRSMAGEMRALLTMAVSADPEDAEQLANRVRFRNLQNANKAALSAIKARR